jgi:hypothetical protein
MAASTKPPRPAKTDEAPAAKPAAAQDAAKAADQAAAAQPPASVEPAADQQQDAPEPQAPPPETQQAPEPQTTKEPDMAEPSTEPSAPNAEDTGGFVVPRMEGCPTGEGERCESHEVDVRKDWKTGYVARTCQKTGCPNNGKFLKLRDLAEV